MKTVLFAGLSFLLFFPGCAARSTSSPSDPYANGRTPFPRPKVLVDDEPERMGPADLTENNSAKPKGFYHRLARGETIYSLSRLYQVPVEKLMRVNHIRNPRKVQVGTLVFIPSSSGSVNRRAKSIAALSWPLRGQITSKFRPRGRRSPHQGIDIDGEYGDPVRAAAGGVVLQARRRRGFGRTVLIDHGNGLSTLYAHLSRMLVRAGDRVRRGEPVGTVGQSGNATGTHLHFEVHRHEQPIDPMAYLQTDTEHNIPWAAHDHHQRKRAHRRDRENMVPDPVISERLDRHWTLREVVDHYYHKMTHRGWTLTKWEIKEGEAELKFVRDGIKAEIEIETQEAAFQVTMKSSHDD